VNLSFKRNSGLVAEGRELLLARRLSKWFSNPSGPGNTISQRLLRLRRPKVKLYVFDGIDFTLMPGECVSLLGGNGSGKSTLLRCLAGVMEPNGGEVLKIGSVAALLTHGYGAYEELPVVRNIILAQQLLGSSLSDARKNAAQVAEFAGLTDRILSPTSQLSEGMRAKISLSALAFATFDVALLDESLNHVDAAFREQFLELTRKWITEGRSLVMTSHDEHLLSAFATRQIRIDNKTLVEPPG
jgi:ABC-type polysaccharide/polyol phosphate transport system ATPase subunit